VVGRGITTRAGQLVLTSLREESRAPVGDLPVPVRLLREVFAVAVRRCFAGRDPREVTGYVRDLLIRRDRPPDGVAAREAEAVIRTVLGERELAAGIPDERRVEIMIVVIGDLARAEATGSDAALFEALVEQAELRVARFDPPPNGRPWRRASAR
jgi:hypothetical protein